MKKFIKLAVLLVSLVLFLGCGQGPSGDAEKSVSEPKIQLPAAGDIHASTALDLIDQGDSEGAVSELELALEKGVSAIPEAEIYTILGNCLNNLDRLEESVVAHKKALELDPTLHNAWVNLGIVYRLLGNFSEAENCYLEALKLAPDYPELHASLGALYIHQEKHEQAARSLKKAVALDGTMPVAHSNLAMALANLGQFERAQKELDLAVELGYPNGPILQDLIDDLKAGPGL